MYLKDFGLREQLQDVIDDIEAIIKQILEALYIDKKLTEKELNEKLQLMVSQYNEKQNEFVDLLGRVSEHQEREQYIRALEEIVDSRDNLLSKLASELKTIENSLTEATYQSEKKLQSVKQSEMNRVYSEDVIRFAHLISKHHSVAASPYWQQGDQARPFPIESHFKVSNLLLSRTQPAHPAPPPFMIRHGAVPMFNLPPGMMPPQQKVFTPNSRPTMFQPNMVGGQMAATTGSPGRGRPPGSGARMSSPSPRSLPKILQRTGSQQSPRFNLMMPPGPGGTIPHPHMAMASSSPGTSSPLSTAPGFISPRVNLPPNIRMQQPMPTIQMTTASGAGRVGGGAEDIPKVEQMSSDSSSSSSSGDEAI